jgi:hypothetical protein
MLIDDHVLDRISHPLQVVEHAPELGPIGCFGRFASVFEYPINFKTVCVAPAATNSFLIYKRCVVCLSNIAHANVDYRSFH